MRNQEAFLSLVEAGLWEKEVRLLPLERIDLGEVLRLAEEQTVIGLVAAGVDLFNLHNEGFIAPLADKLKLFGVAIQIEQRNVAMNVFIAQLMKRLYDSGVNALLVKGQGVAQCYERPLWRLCGDVDLLLDAKNYNKAKELLTPLASDVGMENPYSMHLEMTINSWIVELHGNLRTGISRKVDKVIDRVQSESFSRGNTRLWSDGEIQVFLPGVNEDVIFIFTHIVKHFFKGGIGLRQICDWCRLLWTCREELNVQLLESRIREMGLMSEWKVFACLAVDTLGMPLDAMPFYDPRFAIKASRLLRQMLKDGNFGHNKDISYQSRHKVLVRKSITLFRVALENAKKACIFPLDAIKFFWGFIFLKTKRDI